MGNSAIKKIELDINMGALMKWFLLFLVLWLGGLTVLIFASPFFISQIPMTLAVGIAVINGIVSIIIITSVRAQFKSYNVIVKDK